MRARFLLHVRAPICITEPTAARLRYCLNVNDKTGFAVFHAAFNVPRNVLFQPFQRSFIVTEKKEIIVKRHVNDIRRLCVEVESKVSSFVAVKRRLKNSQDNLMKEVTALYLFVETIPKKDVRTVLND